MTPANEPLAFGTGALAGYCDLDMLNSLLRGEISAVETYDQSLPKFEEFPRHEITRGVNVCPPVDYKPENNDGYCIRCEGFAECSARYLRLNRTKPAEAPSHSPLGALGEPPPP